MQAIKFKNVESYIRQFPPSTQALLQELRKTIRETAPEAEETISYNMPAYKLNGMLCYFAGYENHIGFYPTASPIAFFENELNAYNTSKGTVQFPLNKPIPKTLVKKMVKFKLKENQLKAAARKK
jgi:uncharacterized protein YdhG (YjbR/CyaY superfamily)